MNETLCAQSRNFRSSCFIFAVAREPIAFAGLYTRRVLRGVVFFLFIPNHEPGKRHHENFQREFFVALFLNVWKADISLRSLSLCWTRVASGVRGHRLVLEQVPQPNLIHAYGKLTNV